MKEKYYIFKEKKKLNPPSSSLLQFCFYWKKWLIKNISQPKCFCLSFSTSLRSYIIEISDKKILISYLYILYLFTYDYFFFNIKMCSFKANISSQNQNLPDASRQKQNTHHFLRQAEIIKRIITKQIIAKLRHWRLQIGQLQESHT